MIVVAVVALSSPRTRASKPVGADPPLPAAPFPYSGSPPTPISLFSSLLGVSTRRTGTGREGRLLWGCRRRRPASAAAMTSTARGGTRAATTTRYGRRWRISPVGGGRVHCRRSVCVHGVHVWFGGSLPGVFEHVCGVRHEQPPVSLLLCDHRFSDSRKAENVIFWSLRRRRVCALRARRRVCGWNHAMTLSFYVCFLVLAPTWLVHPERCQVGGVFFV